MSIIGKENSSSERETLEGVHEEAVRSYSKHYLCFVSTAIIFSHVLTACQISLSAKIFLFCYALAVLLVLGRLQGD